MNFCSFFTHLALNCLSQQYCNELVVDISLYIYTYIATGKASYMNKTHQLRPSVDSNRDNYKNATREFYILCGNFTGHSYK